MCRHMDRNLGIQHGMISTREEMRRSASRDLQPRRAPKVPLTPLPLGAACNHPWACHKMPPMCISRASALCLEVLPLHISTLRLSSTSQRPSNLLEHRNLPLNHCWSPMLVNKLPMLPGPSACIRSKIESQAR